MRLWGWFDDSDQVSPSYDPPHDAPCPYCFAPVFATDVRTHCLMMSEAVYAKQSYFYRTHISCDDAAAARGQGSTKPGGMDGRIFDAIAKAGD
jgi:hypothetical protein